MKTIYLIRHGQAATITAAESDKERPLTNKGVSDVFKTGKAIYDRSGQPDLIISSTALRAKSTAALIAEQTQFGTEEIIENDDMYKMSVGSFLKLVNDQSDVHSKVIFVGHNPTISYFIEFLTGEHGIDMLPGTCAEITLGTQNWGSITEETGTMSWYLDVY